MTLDYFYGQAGELFSFFRIPKALFQEQRFQDLSTDAKTLYGILLDRMSLSVKNEWFDKKGRVFIIFAIEDVKTFHSFCGQIVVKRPRQMTFLPQLSYIAQFRFSSIEVALFVCTNYL